MATKPAKMDPLEAAKITDDKISADKIALGKTMPVDPTRPAPPAPMEASGPVPAGQFVPPERTAPPAPVLRDDGPTIETWIAAGYSAESYPPSGYAEKPSSGLTLFKAGSPIPAEMIEQGREEYRRINAARTRSVCYVVLADIRVNLGSGQTGWLRKGAELDVAGYGENGIQRLVDQGAKLERRER